MNHGCQKTPQEGSQEEGNYSQEAQAKAYALQTQYARDPHRKLSRQSLICIDRST
jgi:hypothetical protein